MNRGTIIAYLVFAIVALAVTGFGFFWSHFLALPDLVLAFQVLLSTPYQRPQLIGLRPPQAQS